MSLGPDGTKSRRFSIAHDHNVNTSSRLPCQSGLACSFLGRGGKEGPIEGLGAMQRLQARIAKQLAEFRRSNTEPDYEEQARVILLIVAQARLAEIQEWRKQADGEHL